jgi:pimeloyl-ACP methyl ester carboxylesterase
MLLGRFSSSPIRTALAQALAQVSPQALRARIRAVLSVNVASALSQVRVPVLYLRASEDSVVPREAFGLISQSLPGARVAEVEAPHFLLQAAPVEAARHIRDFMREVTVGL